MSPAARSQAGISFPNKIHPRRSRIYALSLRET